MTVSLDVQQAIHWGKFLELASSMYISGVTNPPQPGDFPTGWKLVKNINAEAGVSFFRQKEFIGFVAQSIVNPSHCAVIMHGTKGVKDYIDDFEFSLTDFTRVPNGGKTEYGFTAFYESLSFVDPNSGSAQTLDEYLDELNPNDTFTVAGFSLGGALATLHSVVLASRNISVEAYLFASPMVGDATFVNTYNALVSDAYRIVNKPDIVPHLPGTALGYEHVSRAFEINSLNYPQIKCSIACFHTTDVYVYGLGATDTNLGPCQA